MNYRVIKENDLFLMTDKSGDIPDNDQSGLGLYTRDTRFLSRMEIRINNQRPILLSSAADENYISTIRLTNPHMEEDGKLILWRESVEIERTRFIYEGALYETFKLTSYYPKAIQFDFSVLLDADFTDMFVIRGFQHGKLGSKTGERSAPGERVISYLGADELLRETKVKWDTQESRISETGEVHFDVELKHQESVEIAFFIAPMINGNEPLQHEPKEAMNKLRASYASWNASSTSISSDMPLFNKLYHRGVQDLRVLLTDLGYGQFPVAGLPWYSVPFGRDSLIAALQMLSSNPQIAKGTLLTMAAYQGQKEDEWRDEQPGKVMHEIRYGELAATNQVPFTPYYGTIDATPLFLLLTAEYYHWTGDLDFVSSLMPHLNAALNWIKEYGDYDKDSFVEYYQKSSKGIANQGWKDSADSVIHSNGDYAEAPIALVEVQGYVYQALTRLAPIFKSLGHEEQAEVMEKDAARLRTRFEEDFWMNDEQFYAIALDKDKKRVDSVTSNAGHILMSGIASPERAKAVAARLVAPDLFGGYGIRTMSTAATGYNPMSYHDGSVWPHDNSLCLLGLSQSGFTEEAITVMQGLLNAADQFEYYRLPELYCGYSDQLGAPVPYPVACSPQAWAAGTPLTFVQALLGLQPNALTRQITIKPALLNGMNDLKVEQLQIGNGTLSLRVSRVDNEPKLEILSNQTGYELVIL
ncbi:amylo-alpha-1,6-glucosidase [Paenibacillus sp. VTT E-133280]|uniref:amylo-alpha-1,6-glucosidase n=1 Tax=Paenibacillus sp. VTT E-133280 TaxID=1986222 RepID=UPI000B9FF42C|nr:amylo-alpha-1,6-glucosidase [Paenibacillus sp. VTT E-133280]OZQ67142.1 amylo-alpha-1,6-glucosidase [Paenibacillus sp. VTT E-133280]